MKGIDGWDWLLMFIAGYFAVSALVNLMRREHQTLTFELRSKIEEEQRRQAEEADEDSEQEEAA